MLSCLGILSTRLLLELHLEDVDEVVHVFLLLLDRLLERLEVRSNVLDFALVVLQRLRTRLDCPTDPQRMLEMDVECKGGGGTRARMPERTQEAGRTFFT